jgi:AraC family transcriptional activator of pobA
VYRRDSAPWPYHAARMHGHRFFVINYYDRGVGAVRLPEKTVQVAAGHVLLMVPGQLHDTSGIAHMSGWVIEFTSDTAAPRDGQGSPLHATGTPWLAFAGRGEASHAEVPAGERRAWEQRFERMESETRDLQLQSRAAIRALLDLVLIDLARLLDPSRRPRAATGSALLRQVLAAIDGRYTEPGLSLAGIARAVGRSASHVTAVVRAETGMTVLQWLTERRMAEARRRLHETDEDVAIVGERVGYCDPAYFARLFRRVHGTSPRSFRRMRG